MLKKIKILLIGSRYTGKGQIGRSWGETDADLPTLQPVILYDRIVELHNLKTKIVAWVLSYDPEFEDLRRNFYKNPFPDGIIFTFDLTDSSKNTIYDLNIFRNEIIEEIITLPPSIVIGIQLSEKVDISEETRKFGKNWAKKHNELPYFECVYPNRENFRRNVEKAILTLISYI